MLFIYFLKHLPKKLPKMTTHFSLIHFLDDAAFEIWLTSNNFQIELLTGSNEKWLNYQRILMRPILFNQHANRLKLTTICSVGEYMWIGDSEANIYCFK